MAILGRVSQTAGLAWGLSVIGSSHNSYMVRLIKKTPTADATMMSHYNRLWTYVD